MNGVFPRAAELGFRRLRGGTGKRVSARLPASDSPRPLQDAVHSLVDWGEWGGRPYSSFCGASLMKSHSLLEQAIL